MLRRSEYPRTDRHVCLRRGALVSGSGGSKVFTARLLGTLELSVVLNTARICSRFHQTSHTEYYGILSSAHGPVVGPCLPTQLLSLPDWTTLAFLLDLSCLSCDGYTAVRTWLIGATSQTHPVPLGATLDSSSNSLVSLEGSRPWDTVTPCAERPGTPRSNRWDSESLSACVLGSLALRLYFPFIVQ